MIDEIKATLKTIQYAEEQEWKNLYTYIDQLQSNWNSLREIIKDLGIDYLLDKMNELESGGKD